MCHACWLNFLLCLIWSLFWNIWFMIAVHQSCVHGMWAWSDQQGRANVWCMSSKCCIMEISGCFHNCTCELISLIYHQMTDVFRRRPKILSERRDQSMCHPRDLLSLVCDILLNIFLDVTNLWFCFKIL